MRLISAQWTAVSVGNHSIDKLSKRPCKCVRINTENHRKANGNICDCMVTSDQVRVVKFEFEDMSQQQM